MLSYVYFRVMYSLQHILCTVFFKQLKNSRVIASIELGGVSKTNMSPFIWGINQIFLSTSWGENRFYIFRAFMHYNEKQHLIMALSSAIKNVSFDIKNTHQNWRKSFETFLALLGHIFGTYSLSGYILANLQYKFKIRHTFCVASHQKLTWGGY